MHSGIGGGGLIQPHQHKMVKKAPWKMPFGTIIDIKCFKNYKKFSSDGISGADAGVTEIAPALTAHTKKSVT